jgi:pantoate--beta-alanine ligase
VRELAFPIELLAGETKREADGLAMSSRNQYLSAEERAVAPEIHRTLNAMADALRAGFDIVQVEAEAQTRLAKAGFKVDYAVARDANFGEPASAADARVALVAARLGRTRLIDNLELGAGNMPSS